MPTITPPTKTNIGGALLKQIATPKENHYNNTHQKEGGGIINIENIFFHRNEINLHNSIGDCWISWLGYVYNLSELTNVYKNDALLVPILRNAGEDISHWFDSETGDLKTHINPLTDCECAYTPEGRFLHVPPPLPRGDWNPCEQDQIPWWKEKAYCIGRLSSKTRKIRIINTLTKDEHIIEVCSEEKITAIQDRYNAWNAHAKVLLDMNLTLEQNGILDTSKTFEAVGMDEDEWLPALHLYFSDDLTDLDSIKPPKKYQHKSHDVKAFLDEINKNKGDEIQQKDIQPKNKELSSFKQQLQNQQLQNTTTPDNKTVVDNPINEKEPISVGSESEGWSSWTTGLLREASKHISNNEIVHKAYDKTRKIIDETKKISISTEKIVEDSVKGLFVEGEKGIRGFGLDISKFTHSLVDTLAPPIPPTENSLTLTIWMCIENTHDEDIDHLHDLCQQEVNQNWLLKNQGGICDRVKDPEPNPSNNIQEAIKFAKVVSHRMSKLSESVSPSSTQPPQQSKNNKDVFLVIQPYFETISLEKNIKVGGGGVNDDGIVVVEEMKVVVLERYLCLVCLGDDVLVLKVSESLTELNAERGLEYLLADSLDLVLRESQKLVIFDNQLDDVQGVPIANSKVEEQKVEQ